MSNSNTACAVLGCHNTYSKTTGLLPKVSYYHIPGAARDVKRKERWIAFMRKFKGDAWIPSAKDMRNLRICSRHFVDNTPVNNPNHAGYGPSIYADGSLFVPEEAQVPPREPSPVPELPAVPVQVSGQVSCPNCRHTFVPGAEFVAPLPPLPSNEPLSDASMRTDNGSIFGADDSQDTDDGQETDEESEPIDVSPPYKMPCFQGARSLREKGSLAKLLSVSQDAFDGFLHFLVKEPSYRPQVHSPSDHLAVFITKLKLGVTFAALSIFFDMKEQTLKDNFFRILDILSTKYASNFCKHHSF